MTGAPAPNRSTYAGLFLVTLCTLMLQLLLTRIFSVTMWYHFAFLVISTAMFGMTLGAIVVYLLPRTFSRERLGYHLSLHCLLFAVSIVASFVAHVWISARLGMGDSFGSTVLFLGVTYLVISVPFVFSGICVCLALTRFPSRIGALYGADLAGAALGCVALIAVLRFTDGPTAVMVVAFFASIGAWLFARGHGQTRLATVSLTSALVLGLFSLVHTQLAREQRPWIRLSAIEEKGSLDVIYEKWNSFSNLKLYGDPTQPSAPFGWGLSSEYREKRGVYQLGISIDAWASTVVTAFSGDVDEVDYLRYDVTNIAHHLRSDADVLVVGSGGGRDVLSALAFDQKSVVAVEMNEDLIDLVNTKLGDFTGHLDRHPRVRFVNDEARSYIARMDRRFDIIQISMIDTWAATAAGAFVLTESSLYTEEAFDLFLDRLKPGGILAVSRWFSENRAEIYRLTALASSALTKFGVEEPSRNIVIVRQPTREPASPVVATLLVSPTPFSTRDLSEFHLLARRMNFLVELAPHLAADPVLDRIASGRDLAAFTRAFPHDISPPTDDRPFFFHTVRLRNLFDSGDSSVQWGDVNAKAIAVLGGTLLVAALFTLLSVVVPLALTQRSSLGGKPTAFFGFFAAIGLGFMLVEISQAQRLTVFLGHPTYGLSVVLSSLLLASGLGSLFMQSALQRSRRFAAAACGFGLLAALVVFGISTPVAVGAYRDAATPVRIAVATAMIAPLGFFMGMAFPLGMQLASEKASRLTAWLWAINGATSVFASVGGVAIALAYGISASYWAGASCYAGAFIAYRFALRAPAEGVPVG